MKFIIHISLMLFLISCGQENGKQAEQKNNDLEKEEVLAIQPIDKSYKFLWWEMVYDSSIRDSVYSLKLNDKEISLMSEQEKAILGYVAFFIGSECMWDGGTANDDMSNLDCKIISALGMGYQCSDKHLGFLNKWFAGAEEVIMEIGGSNCPVIPNSATSQNLFDEISVKIKGNQIEVFFKASGVNLRELSSWYWSETNFFSFDEKWVKLLRKERSDTIYEMEKDH